MSIEIPLTPPRTGDGSKISVVYMKLLSLMAVNTRANNIALDKYENATEKEQRNTGMEFVYNVIHE